MKNNVWISIALILLVIVILLGGTWMMAQNGTVLQMPMMQGMMGGYMAGMDPWAIALMQILTLVVFGLSIAAIVLFVLWVVQKVFGIPLDQERVSPDEVLQMRLAKGEISREQFEEIKKVLRA